MVLTSGTRLGPYEIESPLGAGGMGEVYLARDTRLQRTVAIKVLPARLSVHCAVRLGAWPHLEMVKPETTLIQLKGELKLG